MGLIRPLAWSLVLTLVLLIGGGVTAPAFAATITVDTTTDEFNAGAGCSLREAIQAANTDAVFGGCAAGSGSDTIQLAAGTYTVTLPGLENVNAGGDFDISSAVTIEQVGVGTVTVHGGGIDRVFDILGGGNLTLRNVIVTGGNAQGANGAGILVTSGSLTMEGGSITNNTNANFGGGILAVTSLSVAFDRVSISTNSANTGGGVYLFHTPTTMRNSVLSGNTGVLAVGGIALNGQTAVLENVTVNGNRTPHAGGIHAIASGTVNLVNVTAVDNGQAGADAGNVQVEPGATISMQNTVLADAPTGTGNCTINGGTLTSLGSNLSDDTSCAATFNQPGDQNNVEPHLGPLQNNGGSTQTHALLQGSPAIDAVVGACTVAADQRAVARPKDGNADGVARCDIGAFEAPAFGRLQFSSPTFTVPEDPATATVSVTRTNGSEGAVSATINVTDGTATAPADYTASSILVQFADGEGGSKPVPFAVINDALDEPDETVNLTLTLPSGGAVIGSPAAAVLTITDDDATPGLSINDVSITEGNAGTTSATFTVTLAAPSAQIVTVQAQTADGTAQAGSDYTATGPTTLTFPPGTTSQPFTVPVLGDTLPESTEAFVVNLSSPVNTTIGDAQGTGTIVNDETLPSLSIANLSIPEGNVGTTPVTFTVSLTPASALPVTVQVKTEDGTGLAGSDYTSFGPATLTFAPGVTSQTFTVQVLGDDVFEDDETFEVRLTGATNATVATLKGAAQITNDDARVEQVKPDDDDDDRKKQTEEQRQQRERTNRGNKDDVYTEGNVTEVHLDAEPPYVLVGNRDGDVKVVLLCGDQCPTIRVGDYLEADGEKLHEELFEATEVTVKRAGR